jgi:hypothetical protein
MHFGVTILESSVGSWLIVPGVVPGVGFKCRCHLRSGGPRPIAAKHRTFLLNVGHFTWSVGKLAFHVGRLPSRLVSGVWCRAFWTVFGIKRFEFPELKSAFSMKHSNRNE